VRHTALFLWLDDVTDSEKGRVKEGLAALSSLPGVRSVLTADNVGTLTTDYDLIVDVTLDDADSARGFLDHPAQREATALAAATTKYEWTARITHNMAAG
jgi:hypothetical protein